MSKQEERRAIALTVAKHNGREVPAVVDWAEATELQKQFDAMDAVNQVRAEAASKYPEHDKMHKVKEDADTLGQFLEALPQLGLVLCDSEDDGFGRLLPTRKGIQKILAEHLGINLHVIEYEKRQMLDAVREGNKQEREMNQ